jgi:alpha-ketoglutarate-dependent taurine dioxygenase
VSHAEVRKGAKPAIRTGLLDPQRHLPWVVAHASSDGRTRVDETTLLAWYEAHELEVRERLLAHGAVLFRGFGVDTPAAFERVAAALCPRRMEALDENVPRTRLATGIYTSTEAPAEYALSMHSEYSYARDWPDRLVFCCIVPPAAGGETPIADNRVVLQQLDSTVVEAFTRRQVKYLRNLHGGLGFGLSWQTAFQAHDRSVVEDYCRRASVQCEWKADGGVRLTHTAPGIIMHPRTGERVWFNQAPQFHASDYPADIYRDFVTVFKGNDAEMPQAVCFDDGSPIDVAALQHIRETMHREAVMFPWQKGDVLLLDNVLASHGRQPFSGPRKVLVAMSRD